MAALSTRARRAVAGAAVSAAEVSDLIQESCPVDNLRGRRVLVIVPDHTRTAPVGTVFQALHRHVGSATQALDVMIALGTHQPMSEAAIC